MYLSNNFLDYHRSATRLIIINLTVDGIVNCVNREHYSNNLLNYSN